MEVELSNHLPEHELHELIDRAKREDMGDRGCDLTTQLMGVSDRAGAAVMRCRSFGVVAGLALLPAVALAYDRALHVTLLHRDGDRVAPDSVVAKYQGPLRSILAMERVALNFVTHLSGIATLTARYVSLVSGSKARITDTRKTLPGLRVLQKYAVACGGGVNHRMGLHDAVLVKDNHIAHLSPPDLPAALSQMLRAARATDPKPRFVEVEVDSLDQLRAVLPVQPDCVLLDNMTPELLSQAVRLRDAQAPGVLLEASGGVNLATVAAIAQTGVDRIAVGALTHSAPALDLGLDIA